MISIYSDGAGLFGELRERLMAITREEVMQELLEAMNRQAATPSSLGGSNATAVKTFAEAYQILHDCKD